ncbi:MAG: N-acetyl sugar amidotransferase [Opitutales bacterium]
MRVCKRCVMDETAPDIVFNAEGGCNYCSELRGKLEAPVASANSLDTLIESIRKNGQGKPYDCIVGLSGGVDSSYTLHLVVERGLRPLAVHLDNGWNSESAVHNIASVVRSLKVDLHTHVIEWKENRDLQRSMFAANVVDIEMLMDNAMLAVNYQQAKKYGLKYILAGSNTSTEGMRMPWGWVHCKFDVRNIKAIHKRFGERKIATHPLISSYSFAWKRLIRRVRWISFLDYFVYNKDEAISVLKDQHGYKPYPYKHYESVFTRFYQGYILPKKFNVDKRKVHLSTLVMTQQMSREAAIELLKQSPYSSEHQQKVDYEFVLKKLGFTKEEFEEYIQAPAVSHREYPSEEWFFSLLKKVGRFLGVDR